jgi:hypothetical protein
MGGGGPIPGMSGGGGGPNPGMGGGGGGPIPGMGGGGRSGPIPGIGGGGGGPIPHIGGGTDADPPVSVTGGGGGSGSPNSLFVVGGTVLDFCAGSSASHFTLCISGTREVSLGIVVSELAVCGMGSDCSELGSNSGWGTVCNIDRSSAFVGFGCIIVGSSEIREEILSKSEVSVDLSHTDKCSVCADFASPLNVSATFDSESFVATFRFVSDVVTGS